MDVVDPTMEFIMLVLDANEQRSDHLQIKSMAHKLQLHNVQITADVTFPKSHHSLTNQDRSSNIDYCLCTQGVLHSINYATLVSHELATLTNRRGLLLEIDINLHVDSNGTKEILSLDRNCEQETLNLFGPCFCWKPYS